MERTIEAYSALSINMIPGWVLVSLGFGLFVGSMLLMAIYGYRRGVRYSMMFVLFGYLFLVYGSTVFFRSPSAISQYNIVPFWSYVAAINGEEELLSENILNVIVFIPIGFLFGYTSTKPWIRALIIGIFISVSIEGLQFLLKRGFSELDDVFHNTLGFMIGYSFYALSRKSEWVRKNMRLVDY